MNDSSCSLIHRVASNLTLLFILLTALPFTLANAGTPTWLWASGVGGLSGEIATGVATDAQGNTYVTGYFGSTSLTIGSTTLTNAGSIDMLVIKYDPYGNVLWARSGGGTSQDYGVAIAVDGAGNCIVTGYYFSPTISFGIYTFGNSGFADIFIVKYDANGNVAWAAPAGGAGNDYGLGIAMDGSGNSYITGEFESASMTFGSTTLTNTGSDNVFIAKYDANGVVLWAHSASGGGVDYANAATTDKFGNCYIVGGFEGPSITFGSTALTNANNGVADIFHVKYDPAGNVVWAKSYGGSGNDAASGVAVDGSGNSYLSGSYDSPTLTIGSTTLHNSGSTDCFVMKTDSSGNPIWAKGPGGSGYDNANAIAIDQAGNAYVAGYFGSPSIVFDSTTLINGGSLDLLVAKYSSNGNVVWAQSVTGAQADIANAIATDREGNSYVAGQFATSPVFWKHHANQRRLGRSVCR